jgi:hypothetical protein
VSTETFIARVATSPGVEKSRVAARTNGVANAARQAALVP